MATENPPLDLNTTAGASLAFELESFPGAGAVWVPPPAPAGCRLDEGERRSASPGVGGPALQRFVFSAAQPGRHVLRFTLKRPWEQAARATQQVAIEVR